MNAISKIGYSLTKKQALLLASLAFIYILIAIGISIYHSSLISPFPYYSSLLKAISQGHLDVPGPGHDLSLYENKWYLYWGPGPLLFITPFYFLGGIFQSDLIYTLTAGIGNVLLIALVIKQFSSSFGIHLSANDYLFLLLSFALASPNFNLSLNGKIWNTAQLIGIFYLLVFFLTYFVYLHKKQYRFLFISVIFLNLAWLSRYLLIFHFLIYLFPLLNKEIFRKTAIMRYLLTIILPTLFFIQILFLYNFLRFENIFETGLRYHLPAARYISAVQQGVFFSLKNVPHNIWHYFINPNIFDGEGSSIFLTTPVFILIIYFFRTAIYKYKTKLLFLIIACLIALLHVWGFLLYFATGWIQFGSRYFLDLVPLFFLCTLFFIRTIPDWIKKSILIFGILVNGIGVYFFLLQ